MSELKFLTFKQHAQTRSMWIGSNMIAVNSYWILGENNKFIKKDIEISEAVIKTFDEILVNCVDQYIRSVRFLSSDGGPVENIYIEFNLQTGEIIITNDGRGIPIHFVEEINQYSVQAVISKEFSGSNFDDIENQDRVVGGTNGLGIKLININSKIFTIETVDWKRQLFYQQTCKNNLDQIDEPLIIDLTSKTKTKQLSNFQKSSHTTVKFIPDYAALCRNYNNTLNPGWLNEINFKNFSDIIKTRIYQTSIFINNIDYRYENTQKIEYHKKANIYFNGEKINIKTLSEFMKLFGIEKTIEFKMTGDEIRFPWSVCLGYADVKELSGINMSFINGIYLPKGGSHVNMLYNQLKNSLLPQIEQLTKGSNVSFKDSMLKKLLFIIDVRQLPLPQFAGQTKESVVIGIKDINQMKKIYQIPEKVVTKLWKLIKDVFEYKLLQQDINKSNKKKKLTKIRKYEKAEKQGTKATLYIPEGDSAAKPIRDIIMSEDSPIDRRYSGMYNIQGVPPNVCKKTKEIIIDGEKKIKQDRDLQDNIAFQGLAAVLNLNYNYSYKYKTTQGDKEYETLNYGTIVICVDQDLDGIGNICSLIIVYIAVFWPDLIKRGFVKRLQTPLIRVYMPGKDADVFEFYNQKEYRQWIIDNYQNEDNMSENVKKGVCYYKGLGGHTNEEVQNMGENIEKNIITLTYDESMILRMKLFYGEDTGDRKEILLDPTVMEYTSKMIKNLRIPVSMHFNVESKAFQLYFMKRKLKSAVDGLLPVQRKALAGARRMFKKVSKAKVYQLTGDVAKNMHYQHGDTSMNGTIIKMAQNFTGSNNIPIFIPISNGFGDRVQGRGKSASPRYIDTKYNSKAMDLIFPSIDDYMLPHVFEDGQQAEPEYYVPIVPYAILETTTTTGVGWKIGVWARDYHVVMKHLRNMIKYNYPEKINNSIIGAPYGFLGKVWITKKMEVIIGKTETSKIAEICLGQYSVDYSKEIITVSELPLKIWSQKFKGALLGIDDKGKTEDKDGKPYPCKEFVDDVIDNTGNNQNKIIIKLKTGSLEKINQMYQDIETSLSPIESYLGIYQFLTADLNMISLDGCVKEFTKYEEVMEYWFLIRKDLYIKRLERLIILLELKIVYHEELLRFINMDENKEINIDKKNKDERNKILKQNKFVEFNKTNLLTPKYIKTEELKDHILTYGASYQYIYAITKSMTDIDEIEKLENNINEMKKELEELKFKTWKDVWLSELDKLDKVVAEGIETEWLFGTKQHKFKSGAKK